MEIPDYQPFYIQSADGLRSEVARLGLEIPFEEDVSPLAQSLLVGGREVPNRFCAQPISGGDALEYGAPGLLTRGRYTAYARGGFGLIWVERTSALQVEKRGRLCLSASSVPQFASMLAEMRAAATKPPVVLLQLDSGEPAALVSAARLARDAGFDGVDIQSGRHILPDALARVRDAVPELLLTTRLCGYEGIRGGFGVSKGDFRKSDLAGPMEYVRRLVNSGLQMLNVTSASPSLVGSKRGEQAKLDSENPDEHPLMTLARQLDLVRAFKASFPTLLTVGSGLSWLRQFVSQVASGAVLSGGMDIAGFGRSALACPDLPARTLGGDALDAASSCMVCFACSQLEQAGRAVGCVIRDAENYGAVFRDMRRLDGDRLAVGAARCHFCEAAPCRAKSPTRTDIPAFIKAFREGREQAAYAVLRAGNPLPELVSQTGPAWLEEEGACIETTLTGESVPINDLRYAIAWRARERGKTGVCVPLESTGKTVAVVGGGPAGIAAAVRLIELGHCVHIHEASTILGGVPARILAKNRSMADPGAEIEALLRPAITTGRLSVRFGQTLGRNVFVPGLLAEHDAVLASVGLWKERSLGMAKGVMGALDLLEQGVAIFPKRVAVLAGGDSAMDACLLLRARGVAEIYVIFGGPRSEMHWHMAESWFASPGVHAMMSWQPRGYETDGSGRLLGVQLRHAEFGLEMVLQVDLVVEAMGLDLSENILPVEAVDKTRFYTAGAMVNGGASVGQCIAEGHSIAELIHKNLLR
jgi:NADPH-dependent glutamate synthase beta subunit-like oxidoreductase/2,4-dienoyl-CoA reductase-like NADH-dependent reductase (Old Yellow Enzyme family)